MKIRFENLQWFKRILGLLLPLIVLVFILNLIFKENVNAAKHTYDHASKYLGKKIKIDRDSLMIVDYSLMFDRYYLSDGTEINSALVEKLIKLK